MNEVQYVQDKPGMGHMYRLIIEMLAEQREVPRTVLMREAIDLLLATYDLAPNDFQDFYGKRGKELYAFFVDAKHRGESR